MYFVIITSIITKTLQFIIKYWNYNALIDFLINLDLSVIVRIQCKDRWLYIFFDEKYLQGMECFLAITNPFALFLFEMTKLTLIGKLRDFEFFTIDLRFDPFPEIKTQDFIFLTT